MHDPPLAWLVVLAHGGAALAAFCASRTAGAERDRNFWLAAALLLLLLGINKQLDLHRLAVDLARDSARAHGWYRSRRVVQGLFLVALAIGSAVAAAAVAFRLRGAAASIKLAAFGLFLLILFVFLRAASFHHLDVWIAIDLGGLRSGWWLELAGALLIVGAAVDYIRRRAIARELPPSA